MRAGKIPVMAEDAVATPEDATFVLLFINTDETNKLSWKKSDGTVVVVTSA